MGKVFEEIDDDLAAFFATQRVFFVASAPLGKNGRVNLSPKGLDTFRVLGPRRVGYLDYVGSGAETIAHLRENGRVVIMLCAFDGPPRIVRLHGRGMVVEPADDDFAALIEAFPDRSHARAIIVVDLERISDSCGFGVPLFEYVGERRQLTAWSQHKGETGLNRYQRERNARSLDDLPALRWVESFDSNSAED